MKRAAARIATTLSSMFSGATAGFHNQQLEASRQRLLRGSTFQQVSTIIVTPTRSHKRSLSPRWVAGMRGLMYPMNQQILGPLFVAGHEVGEAYCQAIDNIIGNPGLDNWQYLLTYEDDVIPPPDGLLKLYESIEGKVDGHKYDVVQGLYWTKGTEGQPMIYGNPKVLPKSFIPQVPLVDAVQPCNGLGMGFNLFRLSIFRDQKLAKPYFKTLQEFIPNEGVRSFTQDLYFYDKAGGLGYKFACDTRVKCGHYDDNEDKVW